MKAARIARLARRDLDEIIDLSEERLGSPVAERYRRLVRAALLDLRENPNRPGVTTRPDLPAGVRLYHLRYSRESVEAARRVARPRHFLIFRETDRRLVILRVLHDSMDLPRHVRFSEEE